MSWGKYPLQEKTSSKDLGGVTMNVTFHHESTPREGEAHTEMTEMPTSNSNATTIW